MTTGQISPDKRTYNGNEFLKRAGEKHNYTPEEMFEAAECEKDIIKFAGHFTIQTIDHGLQKMKLYDFQYDALLAMVENRFVALNYPRQSSKTTLATVIILWDTIFNDYRNFYILSNKEDTSKEILERIKLAFMYLPDFLKPGIREWNKKSITFDNGSKIIAATTTSDSIRGKTGSLYCDETAFIENFDEFWKSTYPVMTTGLTARSILTSTPNKMNHWYRIWNKARLRKSNYYPLTVEWDELPNRDEEWKNLVIEDIGEEAWMQEFECSFMGSIGTLIPSKVLMSLVEEEPIFTGHEGSYKIYRYPIEKHEYILNIDTARGKGLDYSTISVIDISVFPFEQVATFRNNEINSLLYPDYIIPIAEQYNNGYILVETNDNGEEVVNRLNWDYEYDGILSPRVSGVATQKYSLGMRTTKKTKRIGCNNLRDLVINQKLIIHDADTILELANFSIKGDSYEAEKGSHDDMVMTLVIFAWYITLEDFQEIRNFDFKAKVYDKTQKDIYEAIV